MQINNSPNTYSPNFEKSIKVDTEAALQCVTNTILPESLKKSPEKFFKIFSDIHNLNLRDVKEIADTPMAFDIYFMTSGTILKANNEKLNQLSQQIKGLNKADRYAAIRDFSNLIGKKMDIEINDFIKTYTVKNGEVSTIKRMPD